MTSIFLWNVSREKNIDLVLQVFTLFIFYATD